MTNKQSNQDAILDNIDMLDVMNEYLDIKQTNKDNYFALCPFHEDRNPSFSINPDKGVWHCFGCGASGNLISFLERIEHKSYLQVMKELSEKSGIQFKTRELTEYEKKKLHIQKILDDVQSILPKFLLGPLGNKQAEEFLINNRKIDKETIKKLGLGYVNSERLLKFFKTNEYTIDDELLSKMVSIGKQINFTIPNRITFPIRTIDGDLIGFSGQSLDKEKNPPKYKHSVYTEYGPQFYYQSLNSKDPIVIVEGFYDQISLSMLGIKNVISSLGTSMNEDKIKAFLSRNNKFIICLDGDEPGIIASKKVSQMLKQLNEFKDTQVKIVLIPEMLDPDDYRKKYGNDALLKVFNERQYSESKYRMITDILLYKGKMPKEQLIKKVISELEYADDSIQKQLLAKELSKKFGLSIDSINEQVKDEKPIDVDSMIEEVTNDHGIEDTDNLEEELLKTRELSVLGYLLHHKDAMEQIMLPDRTFYHDKYMNAYLAIKNNKIDSALTKEILEKASKIDVSESDFESILNDLMNSKDLFNRLSIIKDANEDNIKQIIEELQYENK